MMKRWEINDLPDLPKLRLAVIGHLEWVTFLSVKQFPQSGLIGHAKNSLEAPAGGGVVVAVELARLINSRVDFFTAIGRDSHGENAIKKLTELGLNVHYVIRNEPTRKAISMVDSLGERAITVIGKRLQPNGYDDLPWNKLKNYDGVFITATDNEGLRRSRQANFLATTPRTGFKTLQAANIKIDALIGSGLDPDEHIPKHLLKPQPKLSISTEGALGGEVWPLGRYEAFPLKQPIIDDYGCGDSFAAGVTAGMAAGWKIEQAISLGSFCGAKCTSFFGPYQIER